MLMDSLQTLILADAGGTSTDWAVISEGNVWRLKTQGLNPATMSSDVLESRLEEAVTAIQEHGFAGPADMCFYGAGCRGNAVTEMEQLLREKFSGIRLQKVCVESDMVGAARAVLGERAGIVCIMGTGSNSCLWEGGRIVAQVAAGGFILGDEGSGASMGRQLLSDFIKNLLPEDVAPVFRATYPSLSYDEIVENVYRSRTPQRYLASFAQFLIDNCDLEGVKHLVKNELDRFFSRVVAQYNRSALPVCFVGGAAAAFGKELRAVAKEKGFAVGELLQNPIEGLVRQALG